MSVKPEREAELIRRVRRAIAAAVKRDLEGDEQLIRGVLESVENGEEQRVMDAELRLIVSWLERER